MNLPQSGYILEVGSCDATYLGDIGNFLGQHINVNTPPKGSWLKIWGHKSKEGRGEEITHRI